MNQESHDSEIVKVREVLDFVTTPDYCWWEGYLDKIVDRAVCRIYFTRGAVRPICQKKSQISKE
jgi:hypothetical protein